MESNYKPQEDLMAIRNMMERSSKYLSLSGLSGIFAGCCAIVGVAIAYFFILDAGSIKYDEYMRSLDNASTLSIRISLLIIAVSILIVAFSGAVFFSIRKAKRKKLQFWNKTTKQLLTHLFIPLIAGGLFSLILIYQNNIHLVASTTLIFYGLALVNAGKFTFSEIHYLGLSEIALGLLAGLFMNFGMLFWTFGFGVLHIIYGFVMYLKYER
jgi:hypothetical protein